MGARLVRFPTLDQRHPYQREEIFAPEAALYAIDDLDEAIAAVNDSDFGLVASVMTRDRAMDGDIRAICAMLVDGRLH